ncbi:LacI family DNA-binding transcriptional regulator [Staphylococcus haemolyticus]|uniref:LacI family DNA-binding transcriptional regulator n=1 Tax=Staphylococcus haemolyticus TaxID=1283 RepID=UPI0034D4F140
MSITIKDIATASGFSYSTVSKALRNSVLVNDKTKKIIQTKARELNYIPNAQARSLVSKKSGTIGLIWPSFERAAINALVKEINELIKKREHVLLISVDELDTSASKFLDHRVDGLIVFDVGEETLLPEYVYQNIPTLAYGVSRCLPYQVLDVNHSKSVEIAMNEFMKVGIKDITYIGHLNHKDLRQKYKYETFIQICEFNNITYQVVETNGLTEDVAYTSIATFLKNDNLLEGIFCSSVDIFRALMKQQIDFNNHKIISYDYIIDSVYSDISYSVVGVPIKKIATSIVNNLFNQINDSGHQSENIKLYPTIKHINQ